jgi:hypothetical protein
LRVLRPQPIGFAARPDARLLSRCALLAWCLGSTGLGSFLLGLFIGPVAPNNTSSGGPCYAMTANHMAGSAANCRAFEAALGAGSFREERERTH